MDISKISWFNTASQKMNWLSERQKVIAENVANSDTPDYAARQVESFEDYMGSSRSASRDVRVGEAKTAWGGSMDGNNVVLEEQMILSNETEGQFKLATRLYRKGHELMAVAAGRG